MVMELSPEERDLLVDIVQRRQIDARRAEIADSYVEARRAWQAGELKAQPLEEVLSELHASLDDDVDA